MGLFTLSSFPKFYRLSYGVSKRMFGTFNQTTCGIRREPTFKDPHRKPIFMTPEEAVNCIVTGDRVFVHSVAAVPLVLLHALADSAKKRKLSNISAYHIHIEGDSILTDSSCYDIIRSVSFFVGKNCRKAVEDGKADVIPIFLSDIPDMFRRDIIKLDYALVHLSPPDIHGYMTLGTSVDCSRAACQTAKKIIAVVNKHMPRVHGHGVIHESQVDIIVQHDTFLPLHMPPKESPQDVAIAQHIAANLIKDGATLQMGIGAIPDSVLSSLGNHKDLGIHTEMVSDGVIKLFESGVITNRFKRVYPGKILSSFAMGTQKLYDFLHDNQAFVMTDVSFSNNITIIGQNPKVTAINSCIEVDLTGQVVSDSIGKRIYSGVGGQLDFVMGANKAEDGEGKAILAMHSTTRNGKSKIVPTISEGAGVVTTRSHARYIVTEFGIAELFGKSLRQRAHALINIAHPDHREFLEKEAFERFNTMPSP